MKRTIGPVRFFFLATCLASGACSNPRGQDDEPDMLTHEYRMAQVVSEAQEDAVEAEEPEASAPSGTAGVQEEGTMDAAKTGTQAAIKEARNAGIVGALKPGASSSSLTGSEVGLETIGGAGFGVATIGTGSYGTIGHGSGTGQGYGSSASTGQGYGRGGGRGRAVQRAQYAVPSNTEAYKHYNANPTVAAADDRLSTFAVDVDTASYTIARRKIREGDALPPSAVRVEEFLNYFRYRYPGPTDERPFAVHMDAAPSPFQKGRHLLRVGVQARKRSISERPRAHLVFLVDVSGSMNSPDKLPLVQRSLRILVDNLHDGDTVALVTYAGRTELVLEPTGLDRKAEILSAIENLHAGGGTAMGSGMELAYRMAARHLGAGGISRVIVLSDGDANIGRTDHTDILATIAGHVKEGVTLSTVGFGMGNYKDERMEQLANRGNGNYYYIDGISQARRVFQEQLGGTLEVVAKDVKIQVDFDPEVVARYRLVGYENREVADRDFRNDRVDAGEIGAGHTVTAMYEIEFVEGRLAPPAVVRIRAKKPRGDKAQEWMYAFDASALSPTFERASDDFRFATAVMSAAEILRKSEHAANWRLSEVIDIAEAAAGEDGDRREFIELMRALLGKLA